MVDALLDAQLTGHRSSAELHELRSDPVLCDVVVLMLSWTSAQLARALALKTRPELQLSDEDFLTKITEETDAATSNPDALRAEAAACLESYLDHFAFHTVRADLN
jgi:hypothetical protein